MKKVPSFLHNFAFAAFFVLLFAVCVFAQDLRSDLSNSFIKYDLIRLESAAARGAVERGQTLSIRTAEKTFALSLKPRDLRSPRYRAEDTGIMGKLEIERGAVTTFKGKVSGEINSEARLSIDGEGVEGYFTSDGKRFFIEQARKFSPFAAESDVVVYAEGDLLNLDAECDLAEKIESGKQIVEANRAAGTSPLRVIEIATEADFLYLSYFANNPAAANTEILKVLNMVEGVYENELGLTFSVVYQHTWSTEDPFGGVDRASLVASFQNYWNANFPASQIPRDAAHLFTGKSFALGGGYAYIGVICSHPAASYGLSGYVNFVEGRYLITAHEIGHNLGANHSGAAQNCENTIMNASLTGATPLTFCAYTRSEISNFVNAGGACLSNQSIAKFDFDGDSLADLSIFRPASGEWWYLRSSDGANRAFQFGASNDRLVPADYTGDGKTDAAIFRPSNGNWFVLRSEDNSFYSFPFGVSTDIPAPGDFDGDGQADAAVFRPSSATWFIMRSTGGTLIQSFGANGDIPVVADYDGDDFDDIAIFRPSLGEWWINKSREGLIAFQFGNSADKPVQGDFTGDGKADVAVWRPSNGNWFVLRSENSSFYSFPFGANGDVPAPADFDGDGKFDATVFRPTASTWYVQRTTAGTLIQNFGGSGDRPVAAAFIP